MNPENKNNQPPIELAPQDEQWAESFNGAHGAVVTKQEQHARAFREYQQSTSDQPETEEARDRREQLARESEFADMAEQAAARRARVQQQRDRAARTISRLFGGKR